MSHSKLGVKLVNSSPERLRPEPPQWLLRALPPVCAMGLCASCLRHALRGTRPLPRSHLYELGPEACCKSCWRAVHLPLLLQRLDHEHDVFFATVDTLEVLERNLCFVFGRLNEEDSDLEDWEVVD